MKRRAIVYAILIPIAGFVSAGCMATSSKSCCGDADAQTAKRPAASGTPVNLVTLQDSLTPLRQSFNANKHKLRVVAILSPT